MATLFSTQRKIRFSHCDPAGIVYFPHFFDMINGCVEDWFAEAVGVNSQELLIKRRVGFPIVNTRCEFFRPCHIEVKHNGPGCRTTKRAMATSI